MLSTPPAIISNGGRGRLKSTLPSAPRGPYNPVTNNTRGEHRHHNDGASSPGTIGQCSAHAHASTKARHRAPHRTRAQIRKRSRSTACAPSRRAAIRAPCRARTPPQSPPTPPCSRTRTCARPRDAYGCAESESSDVDGRSIGKCICLPEPVNGRPNRRRAGVQHSNIRFEVRELSMHVASA